MAAMRTITGFRQDDEGDWVAELACLHSQHMRHNPPMVSRPWVLDPAGRQARIGRAVSCPLCDRAERPDLAGRAARRAAGGLGLPGRRGAGAEGPGRAPRVQ